jgi:hypothetical protein
VLLKEACIPSLKSIRLIATELCSGKALGDADTDADNDADTADKSNPYMSPFEGDTKMISLFSLETLLFLLYEILFALTILLTK